MKPDPGGSVHDSTDPVGRGLLNVLAMVAAFASDLIRMRTREGLAVARAAGKLCGTSSDSRFERRVREWLRNAGLPPHPCPCARSRGSPSRPR